MTYTQEQLDELEARVRALPSAERDALVERLVAQGAPGDLFERIHRAGWRPISQRMGDGIEGAELAEVAPRLRRRQKK